jgi:outer membrane protein
VCLAAFAAAAALPWPGPARAGGSFGLPDLTAYEFQGGVIGFIAPKYEGSKSYTYIALPYIMPGGRGSDDDDLTFAAADSIQYRFVKYGIFEAGVLGGINLGRYEADGDKLRGWGKIEPGLIAGGFGALRFGCAKLTASYHHQITGEDTGGVVRLRGDVELPVTSSLKLIAGAGTNYASERYMQVNFGVTADQAKHSVAGLPAYAIGAGLSDVFAGAGAEIDIDDRWTVRFYGEYSRILGAAAASPVIETRDQYSGMLAVTYQFDKLSSYSFAGLF